MTMARRSLVAHASVLAVSLVGVSLAADRATVSKPLSFEERVDCQRRIEQVYWSHRIWPAENRAPKPALAEVLPDAVLRARVDDQRRIAHALASFWGAPPTGDQVQHEIDRITGTTRDPGTLRALFAALDDDPVRVAECLARPLVEARAAQELFARDARVHGAQRARIESELASVHDASALRRLSGAYAETALVRQDGGRAPVRESVAAADAPVLLDDAAFAALLGRLAAAFALDAHAPAAHTLATLPLGRIGALEETDDAFVVVSVLSRDREALRLASVTWKKIELLDWVRTQAPVRTDAQPVVAPPAAGYAAHAPLAGCTDDSWTAMAKQPAANVAPATAGHVAVWTGSEMIVWGGSYYVYPAMIYVRTGGRYDPATNSWLPSVLHAGTAPNTPAARSLHTAVWTGLEAVVWGGLSGTSSAMDTGGRYNPTTDSWAASSLTTASGPNTPSARKYHTAVWTGTEMIVWGGTDATNARLGTGGRYDPATDTWTSSSLTTGSGSGTPAPRSSHSAVWTGSRMVVWGGALSPTVFTNTGGRYDPASDTWTATSVAGAVPGDRFAHTAVWTGTEMIVWGGSHSDDWSMLRKTGGRYDPATDTWAPCSLVSGSGTNVPLARDHHSAVWTGSEMLVWGGYVDQSSGTNPAYVNTGGRYDPVSDTWTATSTTGAVASARDNHGAVMAGQVMLVWGGLDNAGPPLDTGASYCVSNCGHPATWYEDLDHDGWGNGATGTLSCTQPAGRTGRGGDCNDADAGAWAMPVEVARVAVSRAASDAAALTWASQAAAAGSGTTYDVRRGSTLELVASGSFAGSSCAGGPVAQASLEDATPGPLPGDARWFLVRADNSCANATYGDASVVPDPRDSLDAAVACP